MNLRENKWLPAAAALMYAVYTLAVLYLHYKQLIPDSGYLADSLNHIELARRHEVYSLNSILLTAVYSAGAAFGGSVYLSLLDIGGAIAAAILLKRLTGNEKMSVCLLLGLAACMAMPLRIPVIGETFYGGTLGSAVYHNATYAGMKIFALLTLYSFFDLYAQLRSKMRWQSWLKTMVCLTLATGFKPNFVLAFAPGLLVLLIIDLAQTKGKNLWNEIAEGSIVFPSLALCLIQTNVLFSSQNESILFRPFLELNMWWERSQTSFWPGTLRTLVFPLLIFFFFGRKQCRRMVVWFPWMLFGITYAITILLADGGRLGALNFLWGTLFSTLVLFLCALAVLLKAPQTKTKTWPKILCWCAFLCHFCNGVLYLQILLNGIDPCQ